MGANWHPAYRGGEVISKRKFLFLQGVCSPFFRRLALRLKADGHRVHKVNFNAGDALYWHGQNAHPFRGPITDLPLYLDGLYGRLEITDQVVFGDRRPIHLVANERGRLAGVRSHVFEEGYFRPHWVTLERDGVNSHSRLPRQPDWYRTVGPKVPNCGEGQPFRMSFGTRVAHDVVYHGAGFWNPLLFRYYKNHAPTNAAAEYAGYLQRLPRIKRRVRHDASVVASLIQSKTPFFFFPLQLGSDSQILDHSRYSTMPQVMQRVMDSFARHVPAPARLVIKNHPLDTGEHNYNELIHNMSKVAGLEGRVDYMENGDLEALLRHAQGVVTVNSTVGLLSLGLACPTISLGVPIYNMPGLTFQGTLDEFWGSPALPDMQLYRYFRNVVIHTSQINGGFYSDEGIDLAVRNSVNTLVAERSLLESLL